MQDFLAALAREWLGLGILGAYRPLRERAQSARRSSRSSAGDGGKVRIAAPGFSLRRPCTPVGASSAFY